MPDYLKSKIYKLTSSNSNDIYIGSTTLNLCKRKAHHIADYKSYLLNKKKYITSFKIIEYGGDIDICLLEEYSCNNKEQLHQRERFFIDNNVCVNKYIPTRTMKEYYETHKEEKKEYIELNKDKIKEYQQQYRNIKKEYIKEYYELTKDKKKEYYELNKDKKKEYQKQYRAKKKIEREQINNILTSNLI
jgi:hypothetical protein